MSMYGMTPEEYFDLHATDGEAVVIPTPPRFVQIAELGHVHQLGPTLWITQTPNGGYRLNDCNDGADMSPNDDVGREATAWTEAVMELTGEHDTYTYRGWVITLAPPSESRDAGGIHDLDWLIYQQNEPAESAPTLMEAIWWVDVATDKDGYHDENS